MTRQPRSTPQILVTNDDGVRADGLRVLADALEALGDVTVVAPAEESSAVSHALTVRRPVQLLQTAARWYSVDGTPTDCVYVAISEVLGGIPDLVVSGINNGLNVDDDVTYSGTVAGALEGVLRGVPALAVSLQRSTGRMDYAAAGAVARRLAESVLDRGLPRRTLLNVNVPRQDHRGIRVTVQARRTQAMDTTRSSDGGGRSSVWIGSAHLEWEPDERADYGSVLAGWAGSAALHPGQSHLAATGAEGIIVTGSFFGEAVKQARDGMNIPVATSFDGIIERALGLDRPLHVLATAPDSATLLSAELEREATRRSSSRSSRWSGASHKARRCAPGQSSARPARGWRDCAI